MTALTLLNPSKDISYIRPYKNSSCLHSRATLILCPNTLCGQWVRELKSMIKTSNNLKILSFVSKVQFDKYTYTDILDADFVVVSFNFLNNKAFLKLWLPELTENKSYLSGAVNHLDIDEVLEKYNNKVCKKMLIYLDQPNVNFLIINWHRLVVDEFHETYTSKKYTHIHNILPHFRSTFRWCVTGTPFINEASLLIMVDFLTAYQNIPHFEKLYTTDYLSDFICHKCFRRNTKKLVEDELSLPEIKETVYLLKLCLRHLHLRQSYYRLVLVEHTLRPILEVYFLEQQWFLCFQLLQSARRLRLSPKKEFLPLSRDP